MIDKLSGWIVDTIIVKMVHPRKKQKSKIILSVRLRSTKYYEHNHKVVNEAIYGNLRNSL